MRRVYCYPIVFDLQLAVCKSDGTVLTLERFEISTIMAPNPKISESLAGFEEVTGEEFVKLVEAQATAESVQSFTDHWRTVYK